MPEETLSTETRPREGYSLKKTLLLALLLWFLSFRAGAAAILLAQFGAPAWVFVLLLGWLLTFGLPSLCAVLLLGRPALPLAQDRCA